MLLENSALTLYEYQKNWLRDKSRFKIGMFARQTGKTFTTTLEIVLDCLEAESQGKKARWVILSRGERQAKEAINEGVKRHVSALNIACDFLEMPFNATTNTLEVIFPNGSKITALPANPDTARGFSANVFLDEFAFHQDSRKIWTALFPVISAGHKLRIVSTPNGKGNKFYELMTTDDNLWSKHICDIYQAVEAGLPRNIDELKAGFSDEDAWLQEFLLNWLDSASAWIDFDLINSVEHQSAGIIENYQNNPVFVGVDIATRNDLFVIVVLEEVGDVLWCREIIAKQRISFAEQDFLLDEVFNKYKVLKCAIDQTGMGEKPVEDAIRRYGSSRVEGVIFTASNKQLLATQSKQKFEDKKLRLPINTKLRSDIHSIKKSLSATGRPIFNADRDENGHADRAWALFLAIHASINSSAPLRVASRKIQRQINYDFQF